MLGFFSAQNLLLLRRDCETKVAHLEDEYERRAHNGRRGALNSLPFYENVYRILAANRDTLAKKEDQVSRLTGMFKELRLDMTSYATTNTKV
jgi:hypothetical protein